MFALPLSAALQNFQNSCKKLIDPIKIPSTVDNIVPLAPDININYFSLTGGEGHIYDQLVDRHTFNISFPPKFNMYKVSVGAKRLQLTPLQSSLQKEDQIKI